MSDHPSTTETSDHTEPTRYHVTVDRERCDGVFACLVRDDRFREDDEGLADFDPTDADAIDRADGDVTATFTDDRIDDAAQAAAACPLDAISVTPADSQRDP